MLAAQEDSIEKELDDFEEDIHVDDKSSSGQPSSSASRSQRAGIVTCFSHINTA